VARVIRSPRAKRDIVEVIAHTKERWGKAQARAYGQLIEDALAVIATDAQCGKSRNAARPDILALHIHQPGRPARHLLFYRIGATGTVEVLRFLYDVMDFDRHLPWPPRSPLSLLVEWILMVVAVVELCALDRATELVALFLHRRHVIERDVHLGAARVDLRRAAPQFADGWSLRLAYSLSA
jgi:toxin ParE1/3/4